MRLSWDDYFLKMAETACLRSTCLRAQFGAVLVRNHTIISTGYNGAAAGVRSCLERGSASGTASRSPAANTTKSAIRSMRRRMRSSAPAST